MLPSAERVFNKQPCLQCSNLTGKSDLTLKEEVCHVSLLLTILFDIWCRSGNSTHVVSVASVPVASASPMAPQRKLHMQSLNASTRTNSLSIVQPTQQPTHHQPIDQSSAQCLLATRYIGHITFNQHYLDCHPGVLPPPEVEPLEAEQDFILGAIAELPIFDNHKRKRTNIASKAARKKQC